MNEQETITDIIKKIRAEADYIEETARGSLKAGENYDGIAFTESDLESALDLADTKRKEADRLEAAHKREIEALKQRIQELSAEVAAKDEVIKRLNDAIAEEQRRKMATAENQSAVGDCAKLRKALVYLIQNESTLFEANLTGGELELLHLITNKARAALAAPPRNCDSGTDDEQLERFIKKYESVGYGKIDERSIHMMSIFSRWAQMPYEEGGNK